MLTRRNTICGPARQRCRHLSWQVAVTLLSHTLAPYNICSRSRAGGATLSLSQEGISHGRKSRLPPRTLEPAALVPRVPRTGQAATAIPGSLARAFSAGGRRLRRWRHRLLCRLPGRVPLRARSRSGLPPARAGRRTRTLRARTRRAAPVAAAAHSRHRRPPQRLHRLHVRPGGRGARHRRRHRRLPLSPGQDSAAGAAHQDRRQRPDPRHRRLRRPRRADRPDRGRLRLVSGQAAAPAARRAAHPDGGRHGGRRRRHLPRSACRGPVRRRGPLPLARFRVGSHHPRRPGQRHRLLHLRHRLRLAAAVHAVSRDIRQISPSTTRFSCSPTCCWRCSWSFWPCSTRALSTA